MLHVVIVWYFLVFDKIVKCENWGKKELEKGVRIPGIYLILSWFWPTVTVYCANQLQLSCRYTHMFELALPFKLDYNPPLCGFHFRKVGKQLLY